MAARGLDNWGPLRIRWRGRWGMTDDLFVVRQLAIGPEPKIKRRWRNERAGGALVRHEADLSLSLLLL